MGAIELSRLQVDGSITLHKIIRFSMKGCANEHASAQLVGEISGELRPVEQKRALEGSRIAVSVKDGETIFAGVIDKAEWRFENGYQRVYVWFQSPSVLLDQEVKSQSFQDVGTTYQEVLDSQAQEAGGQIWLGAGHEDQPIGAPVIRYHETAWEFGKRMASHYGTSLYPDYIKGKSYCALFSEKRSVKHICNATEYETGVDKRYYQMGGSPTGNRRGDYFYYCVKSEKPYLLGDKVEFLQQEWYVVETSCESENGELVFRHKFAKLGFVSMRKYYNPLMTGLSLLGNVLERHGETVKLHLDIDKEQDAETAFAYAWTPPTGNIMYMMPQEGSRVSLYFSNSMENSAKAVNCVRENGGENSTAFSGYENRQLTTEHGKTMKLYPSTMGFVSDAGESILLDNEGGISFNSQHEISIIATGKITIESVMETVTITSKIDGQMIHGFFRPEEIGETAARMRAEDAVNAENMQAPYSLEQLEENCQPTLDLKASVSHFGEIGESHYMSEKVLTFCATMYKEDYAATDAIYDGIRKQDYDWAKLGENVALGTTVVILVVASGYAVMVAIPATATAAGTVSLSALAAGGADVAVLAVANIANGTVGAPGEYISAGFWGSFSAMLTGAIGAGFDMSKFKAVRLLGAGIGGFLGDMMAQKASGLEWDEINYGRSFAAGFFAMALQAVFEAIMPRGDYLPEGGTTATRNTENIKANVSDRINQNSNFSMNFSDSELDDIIIRGKQLGLDDKTISDFIFVASRDKKPINALELMKQMDNYANDVLIRGYPYKFDSLENYVDFRTELDGILSKYNIPIDDVRIQGSSVRTPNAKDIDIAVFISQEDFDAICAEALKQVSDRNPNNPKLVANLTEAILDQQQTGRLNSYYMPRIDGTNTLNQSIYDLKNYTNIDSDNFVFDISVMVEGKDFDVNPYL